MVTFARGNIISKYSNSFFKFISDVEFFYFFSVYDNLIQDSSWVVLIGILKKNI